MKQLIEGNARKELLRELENEICDKEPEESNFEFAQKILLLVEKYIIVANTNLISCDAPKDPKDCHATGWTGDPQFPDAFKKAVNFLNLEDMFKVPTEKTVPQVQKVICDQRGCLLTNEDCEHKEMHDHNSECAVKCNNIQKAKCVPVSTEAPKEDFHKRNLVCDHAGKQKECGNCGHSIEHSIATHGVAEGKCGIVTACTDGIDKQPVQGVMPGTPEQHIRLAYHKSKSIEEFIIPIQKHINYSLKSWIELLISLGVE